MTQKSHHDFGVLLVFSVLVVLELVSDRFQFVDFDSERPYFNFGVALGLGLAITYWYRAPRAWNQGRAAWFRALIAIGIVGSATLATISVATIINGAFDKGQRYLHQTVVTSKHISRTRSGSSYWLEFKDWRQPGTLNKEASKWLFDSVKTGDSILITTGKGRLGAEWIERLKQNDPNQHGSVAGSSK